MVSLGIQKFIILIYSNLSIMSVMVLRNSLPEVRKIFSYILLYTNGLSLPSDRDKGNESGEGLSDTAER